MTDRSVSPIMSLAGRIMSCSDAKRGRRVDTCSISFPLNFLGRSTQLLHTSLKCCMLNTVDIEDSYDDEDKTICINSGNACMDKGQNRSLTYRQLHRLSVLGLK